MLNCLRSNETQRNKICISYLVVGPPDFSERISDGLHKNAKERGLRIEVHQCNSVTEILKSNVGLCVDFIVFVFDSTVPMSLEQVGTDLSLIDDHYFIVGACCLVHGNGVLDIMSLAFNNLKHIRKKYNIRYLSTNVLDFDKCMNLGHKILNVTSTILGLENGIPTMTNVLL